MKERIDPDTNREYDGINAFRQVSKTNYFVNSDCFWSTDKILTLGKTYVLFSHPNAGVKAQLVQLYAVRYKRTYVNIDLSDVISGKGFEICLCLDGRESECPLRLVSLDFFKNKTEAELIRQYCEN